MGMGSEGGNIIFRVHAMQHVTSCHGYGQVLEDEEGEEVEYRVVGPDEFNVAEGKLSMDSPLGKAMLGKQVDDEIKISIPKGVKIYYVSKIRYSEEQSS